MARRDPLGVISAGTARWLGVDDPLGSRIRVKADGADAMVTVVGVVEDMREHGFDAVPIPILVTGMVPGALATGREFTVWIHASGGMAEVARRLNASMRLTDPATLLMDLRASRDVFADEVRSVRSVALVGLGVFVLGLVLAVVGLYGIVAHSALLRCREIAIRMALGARRGNIIVLVLSDAAQAATTGLALGIVAGVALAIGVADTRVRVVLPAAGSAAVALVALSLALALAALAPLRAALRTSLARVIQGET